MKETTDTSSVVSYLDLHLEIDNESRLIYSLYNFVTVDFKEYDLDTEYCLNIYKYVVCESRYMSDGSGAYIILLKLKTILFTWS